MTAVAAQPAAPAQSRADRVRAWLANPWGKPRWLAAFTVAYLAWALVPVLIAIQFSFNAGRSRSAWQGFSLRWYLTDPALSVLNDPSLRLALLQSLKIAALTMVIATPLGIAAIFAALALVFAISIDDFVISAFLVAEEATVTLPVRLYSATRQSPTPALNALATILLGITLTAIVIAGLALRRSRRRAGGDGSAVEDLAQLDI
jgi:spermidine/putrescine transport system permease protein